MMAQVLANDREIGIGEAVRALPLGTEGASILDTAVTERAIASKLG